MPAIAVCGPGMTGGSKLTEPGTLGKKAGVKPPIFNRTLVLFLGTMILANISSRMNGPLIPLYVQSLGASVQQVGFFFTITSIVPLLFQILGGFISDSIGRLRAIAIGSLAGVAGYALYILSPSWQFLVLAQGMMALATCFVAPSFQAFIAENSAEHARARVFATVESIYAVVGIVGPILGGVISENYGYRTMFAVGGSLYLAATIMRMVMARKSASSAGPVSDKLTLAGLKQNLAAMGSLVLAGGMVTWLFISDGVLDIAMSTSGRLEPLYYSNIIGLTNTQIGSFTSIFSVTLMAVMPLGGWFADRAGERTGLVVGHLLFVLGHALFLLGKTYPMFAVIAAVYGAGQSFAGPAYNSIISKVVPVNLRGTAFGLVSTSLGLMSLPAPYIGGILWKAFGPKAPFVVPLVAGIAIAPLIWVKLAPKPEAQSPS